MNRPLINKSSMYIMMISFLLFVIMPLIAQDNTGSSSTKSKTSMDSTKHKYDKTRGDRGTRSDTTIKSRTGVKSKVGTTTTGSEHKSKKDLKSETSMNQEKTSPNSFAVKMATDLKWKINLNKSQTSQVQSILHDFNSEVITAMTKMNNSSGMSGLGRPSDTSSNERTGARPSPTNDINSGSDKDNDVNRSWKSGSESPKSGSSKDSTGHGIYDTSGTGGTDLDRKGQTGSTDINSTNPNTGMNQTPSTPSTGNTTVQGSDINSGISQNPTTGSGSSTTGTSGTVGTSGSVGMSGSTGISGIRGDSLKGSVGTSGSIGTSGTMGSGSVSGNTGYGTSGSMSGSMGTMGSMGDTSSISGRAGASSSGESSSNLADRMIEIDKAQILADSKIEEILEPAQKTKYEDIKVEWWGKVREESINRDWTKPIESGSESDMNNDMNSEGSGTQKHKSGTSTSIDKSGTSSTGTTTGMKHKDKSTHKMKSSTESGMHKNSTGSEDSTYKK